MIARKVSTLALIFGLVAGGVAEAGPQVGAAKARGDYRPFAYSQQPGGRSPMRYSHRTPKTYSAPAAQAAPTPMVAKPLRRDGCFCAPPSGPDRGTRWLLIN